jgi:hypothetical protein
MNSIPLIKPAAKMATQVLAELIFVNKEGVTSEAVSIASVMIAGAYKMLSQLGSALISRTTIA